MKKKKEITIRSSAIAQKMMGALYGVDVHTINEHIKKIYSDSELEEN